MDFGWALSAMREGKAVKRRAWDELRHIPDEYAELQIGVPAEGWAEEMVVTSYDGSRRTYNPSHRQLLADDWELA